MALFFSGDNRYLPPILITTILLVVQNSLITRQETRQFARVFSTIRHKVSHPAVRAWTIYNVVITFRPFYPEGRRR